MGAYVTVRDYPLLEKRNRVFSFRLALAAQMVQ
jgi:hypothetical protein